MSLFFRSHTIPVLKQIGLFQTTSTRKSLQAVLNSSGPTVTLQLKFLKRLSVPLHNKLTKAMGKSQGYRTHSFCISVFFDKAFLRCSRQTKQGTVRTIGLLLLDLNMQKLKFEISEDILINKQAQCGIYLLSFESINREVMRKGPFPFREPFLVNVDSDC